MGRKNRFLRKGQELVLNIEDLAFGGKGIAKIESESGDFTVFVPNTIPGQEVRAKVAKCRKNYAECKLMDVITPSKDEVDIPYQIIPGAPYAKLPIEKQAAFKKRTTFELFKRIGCIANIEELFDEYIESPEIWHYRNKMEYSFSAISYDLIEKCDVDRFSLGFKHRGTWWMVENLDRDSGIFDQGFESRLKDLREWFEASGLPAWHPPRKEGFFRHLVVRKSYHSNKLLINLVTSSTNLSEFSLDGFVDKIKEYFGDRIEGILHTINDQIGDRVDVQSGNCSLLYGKPRLIEMIGELDFEISMSSFFQTNPKCAEVLYNKVVSYALEGNDKKGFIMDLFCGTGTIAQLLAKKTDQEIIGVDIIESAIDDAQINAKKNGVSNVKFIASDVGKFLIKHPEYQGKIGTIVLDPPRAGIAPKALIKLIAIEAERIVYVSCNPATQARDASELINNNYQLEKVSFVDQFPHTSHIETIAIFKKNG